MHGQRSENHDAQRQRSERKYLNLKDRWIIFAEFYCFDGDLWTDEYQKRSLNWFKMDEDLVDFDVVCDEVTVRPRANGCSGPDQTWFFSMGSRNKRFLAWVTKAKTGSTIAFVLFARGLRPGKTSAGWAGFGFSKRQITLHFERLPIFFIYHHQNQNHQNQQLRKPIKCLGFLQLWSELHSYP